MILTTRHVARIPEFCREPERLSHPTGDPIGASVSTRVLLMLALIAFVVWLVVMLVIEAGRMKPNGARIMAGLFFIAMAVGVNGVLTLLDPGAFATIGSDSWLPVYREFFQTTVASAPLAFGIAIVVFDLTCGCLMLGKHRAARIGLVGAVIFLVLLAPLNFYTLVNVALALVLGRLIRYDFGRGFPEIWRDYRMANNSETVRA
ncbi:MAG TPA: hypothetical protein VNA88_08080 [Candidatus Kapabacteria bacterium]|nr:hypothetical protein [Candidatus Kapabacteria bacterium]